MTNRLEHTYALLIGMDRLGDEAFSHLSTTGEANAQALHSILVGEDRCAYRLKNVISILGEEATRQNIINGFSELENRLRADKHPEKTALIYFSGFEVKNAENTAPTYLIPHDVLSDIGDFFRSALNINMLSGLIQSLSPGHLLFISDSESIALSDTGIIERPVPDPPPPPEIGEDGNAGSKPVPDPPPPPEIGEDGNAGSKPVPDPPPPPEIGEDGNAGSKPVPDPPPPPEIGEDGNAGSKPIPNPAASLGQTLLFSTTGDENSLTMHPHGISTFTWHLMEALSGYSDFARDGRKIVTAHEVWNYIREKVPATAAQMVPPQVQTPVSLSNGIDFAVGRLLGGNGLVNSQSVQPLFGEDGGGQGSRTTSSPFENKVTLNPKGKVYALLVGINRYEYQAGKLDLSGCVKDSEEVERFLKESIANPEERLFIRKLRSLRVHDEHAIVAPDISCAEDPAPQLATRANILAAFQDFLTRATEDDTVFIHYSGHGSFEFRPAALHHIGRADNVMEQGGVLVAQDSFVDRAGKRIHAISDLELRWLINRVAQNGAHVVSAMDCCYSGGNTRNVPDGVTAIKFSDPPQEVIDNARPLSSYVFHQLDEGARNQLNSDTPSAFQIPLAPKAVSLQACRDNELAKEAGFSGVRYGVFTYFLLQVLNTTGGNISYRDLIKLVRAKVKGKAGVSFQSPQIDATNIDDINLSFLSAEPVVNENNYAVSPINATEAWMDAGSLHGLAGLASGETHVDIYPHDVAISEADPSIALSGQLTHVEAHISKIKLEEGKSFPDGVGLMKAIVTASPIPATRAKLVVELNGVEIPLSEIDNETERTELAEALNLVRATFPSTGFKFISEAASNEGYQFRVIASLKDGNGSYRITKRDDSRNLAPQVEGFSTASADQLIIYLRHLTRWEKTMKLENEHPHIIRPDDVEIVIFDGGTIEVDSLDADSKVIRETDGEPDKILETSGGEIELEMKRVRRDEGIHWILPRVKTMVRITDRARNENRFYHAGFMLISSDYALNTNDKLPLGAIVGQRVHNESGIEDLTNGRNVWKVGAGRDNKFTRQFEFDQEASWFPDEFLITQEKLDDDITETEDHYRLIVSTEEFDLMYLQQQPVEDALGTRGGGNRSPRNQLEAFLREAGRETRAGRRRGTTDSPSDWFSTTVTVRTKFVDEVEDEG